MEQTTTSTSSPQGPIITSHFPGGFTHDYSRRLQQWTDYEVATSLEEQHPKIRVATFRSVMGKECLQILLNLKLTEEKRIDVDTCLTALECYFKPKRNIV